MKWKDFVVLHALLNPEEQVAAIIWTRPDVFEKAEEEYPGIVMTNEIADEVLSRMDRKADCENGMTWDSLEYHLQEVLHERNLI